MTAWGQLKEEEEEGVDVVVVADVVDVVVVAAARGDGLIAQVVAGEEEGVEWLSRG